MSLDMRAVWRWYWPQRWWVSLATWVSSIFLSMSPGNAILYSDHEALVLLTFLVSTIGTVLILLPFAGLAVSGITSLRRRWSDRERVV